MDVSDKPRSPAMADFADEIAARSIYRMRERRNSAPTTKYLFARWTVMCLAPKCREFASFQRHLFEPVPKNVLKGTQDVLFHQVLSRPRVAVGKQPDVDLNTIERLK